MDFWVKISLKSGFLGEISLKVIFEEIWVFGVFTTFYTLQTLKQPYPGLRLAPRLL